LISGGNMMVLAWMAMPLRWVVLAAALVVMERRLLSWVFPLPRGGCPQCGYPVAGRSTCPECGLALGVGTTAPAPPGYQR
jgi:hypothetical protein